MKITFIGTLPPQKGNAYYCMGLSTALAKHLFIDFIAFKKLYPDWLYPGGTIDQDPEFRFSAKHNVKVNRLLSYYNPFSWILAATRMSTAIVHSMWWSFPLAPVYVTIFTILKLRQKTIVLTVHNVLPHKSSIIDTIAAHIVFRLSDHFIVHSRSNKELMVRVFKVPQNRITVIPMGTHEMYCDDSVDKSTARNTLEIKNNVPVAL